MHALVLVLGLRGYNASYETQSNRAGGRYLGTGC